ncbi:hypothetical protein ATL17_1704 [Maritalea mobilis]|uniref:Uncharacterized protein n=1 Tax=Maritalea mobilis TaxID=483324 RepID=A0A4R6VKS5_9HYPH|nr:hypothetical protein ATL17_1704 [Maritalea mobilis]
MPIINDRDNNKTIDTDTGIYVELVSNRPNEQLSMFNIVNGEHNIYLETVKGKQRRSLTYINALI